MCVAPSVLLLLSLQEKRCVLRVQHYSVTDTDVRIKVLVCARGVLVFIIGVVAINTIILSCACCVLVDTKCWCN